MASGKSGGGKSRRPPGDDVVLSLPAWRSPVERYAFIAGLAPEGFVSMLVPTLLTAAERRLGNGTRSGKRTHRLLEGWRELDAEHARRSDAACKTYDAVGALSSEAADVIAADGPTDVWASMAPEATDAADAHHAAFARLVRLRSAIAASPRDPWRALAHARRRDLACALAVCGPAMYNALHALSSPETATLPYRGGEIPARDYMAVVAAVQIGAALNHVDVDAGELDELLARVRRLLTESEKRGRRKIDGITMVTCDVLHRLLAQLGVDPVPSASAIKRTIGRRLSPLASR